MNFMDMPRCFHTSEQKSMCLEARAILCTALVLAQEMQMDRLLKKWLQIAIENAGAQKGVLVLKRKEQYYIAAEGTVGEGEIAVYPLVLLEESTAVPRSLIKYVARTQHAVMTGNAEEGLWVDDSYIAERQCKSILCFPILYHDQLSGIVYLENNLVSDCFTDERLNLLELLASQAAISLENAHLYEELQMEVERSKGLEKEILEIGDREQQRIGQDLHDSIGQLLTGIMFLSKNLYKKLKERSLVEAEAAEEINILLKQGVEQVRYLAYSLYPVKLKEQGIIAALEEFAANIAKTFSVSCRFIVDDFDAAYDVAVITHIYRIAQEAVHNAIRHGHATQITIAMKKNNGQIVLQITDNGIGFPSSPEHQRGMGLLTMRYRAEMIHGKLEIQSNAESRTSIVCSFPTDN